MKKPIILVGGGGHCISCIDVIEKEGAFNIVGILDLPDKIGERLLDYYIIGTDDELINMVKKSPDFLITAGQIKTHDIRRKLFTKIKKAGGNLPVIVSPLAYVSKYAMIGEGTVVMHHAFINANTRVGKCGIINSKALIEHEVIIGDFTHISTGSIINGQCKVGDNCFIGSNSVAFNNIAITNNTVISAGSIINKDITESGIYIGNPLYKSNIHA